jgi:RHS repeat-associated protein
MYLRCTSGIPRTYLGRDFASCGQCGTVAPRRYGRRSRPPAEDDNTTVCYPDYWTPPGTTQVQEDWFNKYVVSSITQNSTQVDSQPVSTSYCYGAAPGCLGGGAWHYDDDPLLKSSQRTWDQWRGFATVTTSTGIAPDPVTDTVDTYFQGMNGDYQSGGGTTSASLSATVGGVTVSAADDDQWAGMNFEHAVYDGSGGSLVSATVTTPWTSAATATQTGMPSPLPSMTAYLTGTAETQAFTALGPPGGNGGFREADDIYTHDSDGRVTAQFSAPDAYDNGTAGDATEDTCTQTQYAASDSLTGWPVDLPAEVIVTHVTTASACPVTGTPTQAELVSDTQDFYDNNTTLTHEDLTEVKNATSYTGTQENYTTEQQTAYDQYGRVTSQTDADGKTTTTAYTPATGPEPASITVTSPPVPNDSAGLITTAAYDPIRELPVTITNPAGLVTTDTYDALGRLTAVWTPGHPQATDPAQETFSYDVSDTGPSVVTTNTITAAGTYLPSETLYDSLGRAVETQTETATGDRDVTDTTYDTDGWPLLILGPYYAAGAPSGKLVDATSADVPDETGYYYDGTGRVLRQVAYDDATETWETDYAYGGDYTTVTPPAGGTAQTTYVNGEDQDSDIYQYLSATPPSTPPAPGSGSTSGWDQTAYTYTPAGQLATITDAAGNQWSYGYDLAGDQTTATTPDTGTTTSAYDADGNLTSVTDARGKTTSYAYDALGRKIAEYDTTGGAGETASDQVASWTYDTLAKGQLSSEASYTGGSGSGGTAYTTGVLGYNAYGLPTGTQTIIPSGPLAGTYKQGDAYTTNANLLASYYDYAAAGLPAETVDIGYNSADEPVSLGSSLWYYVAALSYTELGQPHEYAFGTSSEPAWLYNTYNPQTGQLTNAEVQAGATPATIDNTSYAYNNAGNITSESDTATGNYQCYQYDYLGQLTSAWAQGSSGCAATPSASVLGGPSPYWQQLAYNTAGDITTDNWTYSATNTDAATNTYSTTQPHALAGQDAVTSYYGGWTSTDGYDAAGNMTNYQSGGYLQQYTWNDQDQLTQTSDNSGDNTTYIYDADGNLLLQTDNTTTTTLYLPDEEITASTSTSPTTYTADRYYTLGGVTVAVRPSAGDIQYLTGNQQNTSTTAVDATTLAATYRYYGPFGNQLAPDPGNWPGNKAFVGGTSDTITGLTNLGAREYNTALSTFVTPDPILTPDDPQDLDPYTYAADNPVTDSDPSGKYAEGAPGTDCYDNSCTIDYKIANGEGLGYTAPTSYPTGNIVDLVAAVVHTVARAVSILPGGQLGLAADNWADQALGVNSNSDMYALGNDTAGLAGLLIPGGDEADAADVGLGVLDRTDSAAIAAARDANPARFAVGDDGEVTVRGTEGFYRSAELQEALENLATASQDIGTAANGVRDIARGPVASGTFQPPGPIPPTAYAPPVPVGSVDLSSAIPAVVMAGTAAWMAAQYWWNALFG